MIAVFKNIVAERLGRRSGRMAPKIVGVSIATMVAGGCSIHPVQREVTGLRNVDIVNQIKCETRLAIQDKAIQLLESQPDRRSQDLGHYLRTHREAFMKDPRSSLTRDEQEFYERYVTTGIALSFTFNITETNKLEGSVDPIKLITNGTAGIGLSGSSELIRQNERRFTIADTFLGLLTNQELACPETGNAANYAYPISGRVGMYEMIDTFIDLNEGPQLRPIETGSARVFADTLTFTTTLTGDINPHVLISPIGRRFGLAAPAGLTLTGTRADKHAMIVGLSLDKPLAPLVRVPRVARSPAFVVQSPTLMRRVPSATAQSALEAVEKQRIDSFYDRLSTVPLR